MRNSTSILIVGGGPAGSVVALELALAGCEVVLLEKQSEASWKVGETLPPESRIHLHRLGHWEQFLKDSHLPSHGIVSIWGHPDPVEKSFVFNPFGNGWQLDRAVFEASLLNAASEAGCCVRFNSSAEQIERVEEGWLVRTSSETLRTKWLIDCTGRTGAVIRREGGKYKQLDQLVSVFAIASTSRSTDQDSRTYVESQSEGWCYTALMPNGMRTVAFQTDRNLLPQDAMSVSWFRKILGACPEINRLLTRHEYQFTRSPQVTAAHSGRFGHCKGDNWIAVGDAAMTFDPLSGQGSTKAFESARNAVQAILQRDDYSSVCERQWKNYLRERNDYYLAERRWSNAPFWRRRHLEGISHDSKPHRRTRSIIHT